MRPGRRRSLWAVLAVIALAAACSRQGDADAPAASATAASAAAPPAAQASAASAPPAALLMAVPEGDAVHWRRVDAASGQAVALGQARAPVELLALDDTTGEFYFSAEGGLWRDSWRQPAQPAVRLAGLPPLRGVLHAVWVDAADGALRAIEMREATATEQRGMKVEPPDAQPYWAVMWRLQGAAWVQHEQRATAWGVDGSVGPAVLDPLRHERGRSARRVDDAASCISLCDEDTDTPPGIAADVAEEWRQLPHSGGRLRFGVALADRWQPVGPVVWLAPGVAAKMATPAQPEGLRLLHNGRWTLVWPQAAGALVQATTLVNLETGTATPLPASVTLPAWVQ